MGEVGKLNGHYQSPSRAAAVSRPGKLTH